MDAPHELFTYGGRRFLRIELSVRGRRAWCTVPQRIAGRYEVRDLLAHGGGGVVLVGYDVPMNHEVLIKAGLGYRWDDYADRADTAGAVEHLRRVRHRLQSERRILVQLRRRGANGVPHPHAYVYDWNPALAEPLSTHRGDTWSLDDPDLLRSEPFLVMQRIHGTSIHELLKTHWREGMPVADALHIMRQIVAVLLALHEPFTIEKRTWQLVYQDLKPGNVLLGDALQATLIDFGGCQLIIDGTLVLHGAHTPGFCPPEQAAREQALHHRLRIVGPERAERSLDETAARVAANQGISLDRARRLLDEHLARMPQQFDLTPGEAVHVLQQAGDDPARSTDAFDRALRRRAEAQVHATRLTPAADVYGVGSTLYHMLTGINPQALLSDDDAPAASDSRHAPRRIRRRARARAVHQWDWNDLGRRCPAAVCRFVRHCLAPSCADRFPDAAALAADLATLA